MAARRVTPAASKEGESGSWRISTDGGVFDGFDVVINALWEGKSAVDQTAGRPAGKPLTYRYRVAVFMKAPNANLKNVVITVGPFGDVKNYDGQHVYLSWYPAGLLLECRQEHAPRTPILSADQERKISDRVFEELGRYFSDVAKLSKAGGKPMVRGGWIVAPGDGSLADPLSSLHRRDELGISRVGDYYSVDTSKYSVAPWLASQLAEGLAG